MVGTRELTTTRRHRRLLGAFIRRALGCCLLCAAVPTALAATAGEPGAQGGAARLFRVGLGVYREISAEDGAAILAKAVELEPGNALYAIYLSDALYRSGVDERRAAGELAAEVSKLIRDDDLLYLYKGKRAQMRGDVEDALYNYRESLLHMPSPHAFYELAALEIAEGDIASADVDVTIALQHFPDDYFLQNLRGTIRHEQGRYAEAIEAFNKAIEANPALPEARVNRGHAYYQSGEYDKALKDCEAVLSVYPDRERAKYVKALALEGLKRYGAAREIIDTLVEAHPDEARLWLVQGWLYYKTGKARDAERILKKYVAEMPDDPEGHYKLATLYAGRRKSGPAFMKLRRALELNYALTLQRMRADMEWDRYRDTRKFKALLDETKPG